MAVLTSGNAGRSFFQIDMRRQCDFWGQKDMFFLNSYIGVIISKLVWHCMSSATFQGMRPLLPCAFYHWSAGIVGLLSILRLSHAVRDTHVWTHIMQYVEICYRTSDECEVERTSVLREVQIVLHVCLELVHVDHRQRVPFQLLVRGHKSQRSSSVGSYLIVLLG